MFKQLQAQATGQLLAEYDCYKDLMAYIGKTGGGIAEVEGWLVDEGLCEPEEALTTYIRYIDAAIAVG